MTQFTGRSLTPEWMDDPEVAGADLEAALRFIRFVNRRLGGTASVLRQLGRWSAAWPRDRVVRIIDVGTGCADIPCAIVDWAERRGHRVEVTGVDLHEGALGIARRQIGERSGIALVHGDARRLMDQYEPAAFDYAHAGMFLHHLSDIEVITVLRIMDRLTGSGVIWNDLIRSPLAAGLIRMLTLGHAPITRHDALASVRAGFTTAEAVDLACRAGFTGVTCRRHPAWRFTLVGE